MGIRYMATDVAQDVAQDTVTGMADSALNNIE